jgi:hypothetical protein
MLKAGALFYSVIISLVIAVLTGSVIMLSGLTTAAFNQSLLSQELELNANSGLNLLLSDQTIIGSEDQRIIDLFGKGNDSVMLERKFWGAYEIAIVKAKRNSKEAVKIASVGYLPDTSNSYCLYVVDQDKPLAVCGNTTIKGIAFLPKAGVKRAYIEGQNYTGSSLVYGEVKNSSKILPEFNKALIERIRNLPMDLSSDNEMIMDTDQQVIKNSFHQPAMIFRNESSVKITEGYEGNIMIISKTLITVEADAVLKDVIIYAPKIIIKDGFEGNLQAFALDSIIVNTNVTLNYPSVLGIISNSNSKNASAIVLNEKDTVSGSIFICGKDQLLSGKSCGVFINKDAVVFGTVFSNGYADVKGSVFGSLMCRNILLNTKSSIYENHFLNAVIDGSVLSSHFVGIGLVKESDRKGVVKWLK